MQRGLSSQVLLRLPISFYSAHLLSNLFLCTLDYCLPPDLSTFIGYRLCCYRPSSCVTSLRFLFWSYALLQTQLSNFFITEIKTTRTPFLRADFYSATVILSAWPLPGVKNTVGTQPICSIVAPQINPKFTSVLVTWLKPSNQTRVLELTSGSTVLNYSDWHCFFPHI